MIRHIARLLFPVFILCVAGAASATEPGHEGLIKTGNAKRIPKLSIRWDCGQCEENAKVAPLLTDIYEQEALGKGLVLASDEFAEVTIVDYRQRNPANRILFGVMAGKDRLGVQIKYRGQVLAASDYSANIIEGMNALCESVAKKSLEQILAAQNREISSSAPSISNADAVPVGTAN